MKKIPDEIDVLSVFVDEMEREGVSRNLIHNSINEDFLKEVKKHVKVVDVRALENLTDRCLAREWLKHRSLGCGKYGGLQITAAGGGVVRSKRAVQNQLNSRTSLKRLSDYISDHSGLFILIGSIVAVSTLTITIATFMK